MLLGHLSVRAKIIGLLIIATFSMALLASINLYATHQSMLEERKTKLRNLTEAAISITQHYYQLSQSGSLSTHDAQTRAQNAIATIRYDESEYLFIFDAHPKMLMHPVRKDLINKDLNTLTDPTGRTFMVEMRDALRQTPSGAFVEYLWAKPNRTEPVPKLSYGQTFAPWGWSFSTGVYLDDLEEEFWRTAIRQIIQIVIVLSIMQAIGIMLMRQITQPLKRLVASMTLAQKNHDLSIRVPVTSQDEFGQVSLAFNDMLMSMQTTLQGIHHCSTDVTDNSSQISQAAHGVFEATRQQSEAIYSSSAALEQINASIDQIVQLTRSLNDQAAQSHQHTTQGVQQTEQLQLHLSDSKSLLQEKIAATATDVSDSMTAISNMTRQVRDIADQTNLLALNAAIEAARAGESGRGFAVVADEVRQLAEKSAQSASEIDQITQRLQRLSDAMHEQIQQGCHSLETSSLTAQAVTQILQTAQQTSHDLASGISTITHAQSEQGEAVSRITQDVEGIANAANTTQHIVTQALDTVTHLNTLATELNTEINRFQLQHK